MYSLHSNPGRELDVPQSSSSGRAADFQAEDFRFALECEYDSIFVAPPRAGRIRALLARHFKRSLETMVFGPSMRGLGLLMLGILITSSLAKAQEQRPLYLMPVPASVQIGAGRLLIDAKFSVA